MVKSNVNIQIKAKVNRIGCIGYYPHLWNPPLQPIPSKATACGTMKKHHNTGTLIRCSCLTSNDFAVQTEMVAVETSIDVGNIIWIFCDCLQTILGKCSLKS